MGDHLAMVGDPRTLRRSGPRTGPVDVGLQAAALAWYEVHGRPLVIRHLTDPYTIWLAETMSQQTQIGRVGEALPAFLACFPDVPALASASVGEVLRAWGGLGYPRRALALREAARELVLHHDACIPRDVAALETLPGVGPYTARAVAATAFGVPVTALDVNARRVLGRVLGAATTTRAGTATTTRAGASTTGRAFQAVADALAPPDTAADWNHALMDIGATICRPAPECAACPLQQACAWRRDHPADGNGRRQAPRRAAAHPSPAPVAFRDTNRYVRGRVLASLRDAPPKAWSLIEPVALSVAPDRLERAVTQLQQEGLIEIDERGRARLPIA